MICNCCSHMKIVVDDEMCTHAKCMKTSKRGKDITWAMSVIVGNGIIKPGEKRVREVLDKMSKEPSWCPILRKGE